LNARIRLRADISTLGQIDKLKLQSDAQTRESKEPTGPIKKYTTTLKQAKFLDEGIAQAKRNLRQDATGFISILSQNQQTTLGAKPLIFIAQGGHVITFYQETGKLQAEVQENLPVGFSRTHHLPVYIEPSMSLARVASLKEEEQKRFIQVNLPKNGQEGYVYIGNTGLKGGGNIGSKNKEKINKDKEKIEKEESKEDLELEGEQEKEDQEGIAPPIVKEVEEYQTLLEEAIEGNVEAQFQLGKRAYEAWQQHRREEAAYGAREWLTEAAAGGHTLANSLLEELNRAMLLEEKLAEKELVIDQSQSDKYAQALESLQTNQPKAGVIDLSQVKLDRQLLEKLKEAVDNNFVVGYIYWGQVPADCQQLKEQIEKKLVENICNYTYHPSDYIHGLLSNHVYSNPQQGQEVDLQVFSQELGHELPSSINTNWKVIQVKDDSDTTGYYSALYVNQTTHQAVLAFQGTKLEGLSELSRKQSDLQEDIDGVLGKAITKQQALAYVATKVAVKYVKDNNFNLSITGHSLGGYLAELGVAFCYRNFNYRQVKGIVFDSPGAVNKLVQFKSNIKNPATTFHVEDLPIVTYLSAPNLVNACDGHAGEVYRLYPTLKWSDWKERWLARASRLYMVGTGIEATNKGLLALTGHSLVTILGLFDPGIGKPQEYVRVADWPKLNTDNLTHVGKKGSHSTSASLITVLKDCFNIKQEQYWETLAYLDADYKEVSLDDQKEFKLRYEGHYNLSPRKINEHILLKDHQGVDWYLKELHKYKDKLEQLPTKEDITLEILKNILRDYEVTILDGQPYIRLTKRGIQVEALRDKMQRALAVLPADSIEKAFEVSTIHALSKQLEARSIQQLPQLHSHIAQAKSKDYIARKDKQQELIQKLGQAEVCVVYGHGGVGKSTFVAQYGHERKDQQAVWWMPAETQAKLLSSYESLAQELGIAYQELAKQLKGDPSKYLPELGRKVYNALEDRNNLVC
jgi:hypothetical protein